MADTASPPGSAAEKVEKARATEHEVAQNARERGAEVFEFDPNATPAQKVAEVRKVCYESSGGGLSNHAVDLWAVVVV